MHMRQPFPVESLLRPAEGPSGQGRRVPAGKAAEPPGMHYDPRPAHRTYQPGAFQDIPHRVVPFGRVVRRERDIIGRVQGDGDPVSLRFGAESRRRIQLHA